MIRRVLLMGSIFLLSAHTAGAGPGTCEEVVAVGHTFASGPTTFDGAAIEIVRESRRELGLAVVAAAVEHGHRDAVADECSQQDFVAALDFLEGRDEAAEPGC